MRKLLTGLIASVFSLTLLVSPAAADLKEQNCVSIVGPNGNTMGLGCASIETRDWRPGHIRAHAKVERPDSSTLSVQYDFIALYKNGDLYAADDRTPWWGWDTPYWTEFKSCSQVPVYKTLVKMRMQRASGNTSDWYTIGSQNFQGDNWCAPLKQRRG